VKQLFQRLRDHDRQIGERHFELEVHLLDFASSDIGNTHPSRSGHQAQLYAVVRIVWVAEAVQYPALKWQMCSLPILKSLQCRLYCTKQLARVTVDQSMIDTPVVLVHFCLLPQSITAI